MGITLRLRMEGDTAWKWLPVAKAHLAAINARAGASMVRNVMDYPDVRIVVTRGTVVDQIDIKVGGPYIFGTFNYWQVAGSTDWMNDIKVGDARVGPEESVCQLIQDYTRIPRFNPEQVVIELARSDHRRGLSQTVALHNRQARSQKRERDIARQRRTT